jgi:hypothetical protein
MVRRGSTVRVRQRASAKRLLSSCFRFTEEDVRSGGVHGMSTAPNVTVSATVGTVSVSGLPRSPATSTLRPCGGVACVAVEKLDGVFASVAHEVAVVLVDHRHRDR